MSLLIEAEKLADSANGPLATGTVCSASEESSIQQPPRNAWREDEEDDAVEPQPTEDHDGDEIVAPVPIEEEEEDDPFDDFDEEDFDDDFDDDFEEELEDDYEIEPDDTDMFPPKLDDDDELLDDEN